MTAVGNTAHLQRDQLLHNGRDETRQPVAESLHLDLNAAETLRPCLQVSKKVRKHVIIATDVQSTEARLCRMSWCANMKMT